MDNELFAEAVDDVKRYVTFLGSMGCKGFDCGGEVIDTVRQWGKDTGSKFSLSAGKLGIINKQLLSCQKCKLALNRANVIPGRGNPSADVLFVADVPSEGDDHAGMLFTGEVGDLFGKMINAIGLSMEDVYITTVVKCRPDSGRKLQPGEYRTCMAYLEQQIDTIKPRVICTLGAISTLALLGRNSNVAESRGTFHPYKTSQVFPTFHPAFLISHPEKKREAWTDLQALKKAL